MHGIKLRLFIACHLIFSGSLDAMEAEQVDPQDVRPPEAQQEIQYQPQRLTFRLVSEGNCDHLPRGGLSHCRFPEIKLREIGPQLPPLPFETIIRVRTANACQLEGPAGFLKIRMGKYGALPPNEAEYLGSDQLAVQRTYAKKVRQDEGLPLGELSIYPKLAYLFSHTTFHNNCTIELDVEFNVIALNSSLEAENYLAVLNQKIEELQRSQAAFQFLHDRLHTRELAGGLAYLIRGKADDLIGLRAEWNGLVQHLAEQPHQVVHEFSPLFDQFMDDHQLSMEEIRASLVNLQGDTFFQEGVVPGFDLRGVEHYQLKIERAQFDAQKAAEFLNAMNLERMQEDFCHRDIGHIFFEEICEPHGLLDQIVHSLAQIGRRG